MSCSSEFIFYLGTCKKCGGQFKRRHSGHKQEVKNRIGGLGQHYGGNHGCGYDQLRMMILEQVEKGNHEQPAKREIYWENQLQCFVQNEGNVHYKRKGK